MEPAATKPESPVHPLGGTGSPRRGRLVGVEVPPEPMGTGPAPGPPQMSRLALMTALRRQCRITPLRGQTGEVSSDLSEAFSQAGAGPRLKPPPGPATPAAQASRPRCPRGTWAPSAQLTGHSECSVFGVLALPGVRGQARPRVGRAQRRVPEGEGWWRHVSRRQADPGGGAEEGTQAEDRGPTPCFLGLTAESQDRGQGHVDPAWLPWAQGTPAPPVAAADGTLSPQEPRSHRAMTLGHMCPQPPGRPESVRVPFRATERLMSNV